MLALAEQWDKKWHAARGRVADESAAARAAVVTARRESKSKKQRDAQARLDVGTSGNAFFKYRDGQYARGNFDTKDTAMRYNATTSMVRV